VQLFESAHLKLTAFYLAIIMLVSGFFSLLIYKGAVLEFERSFSRIEYRLRTGERDIRVPLGPQPFFREDLEIARRRVLTGLFYINGVIFFLSAAAGYFLAGRTLEPIEKSLEEQKRFVADASHELRTPLTALKTSLEVALWDKKMSLKEAKKVLESNLEDINGLQSLTNNLLVLTRYQENANNSSFQKLGLVTAVENAYKKIRPLAREKGVEIELKIKDIIIDADKEGLEEMLLIFLDNGVKFTPQGGKVTVSAQSDKKYAILEIKDTGIGIAKEDLPHIFDRFYRADKSRANPGFGLGLSLAKKIIERHQGSVEVTSVFNQGTTFTVKLPLKQCVRSFK